jgi:hypothetical protein
MDSLSGITKQTFCDLTVESKLDVLFDCLVEVNSNLKKSNGYDKMVAFTGGVVGGIAAVLGKGLFWGK